MRRNLVRVSPASPLSFPTPPSLHATGLGWLAGVESAETRALRRRGLAACGLLPAWPCSRVFVYLTLTAAVTAQGTLLVRPECPRTHRRQMAVRDISPSRHPIHCLPSPGPFLSFVRVLQPEVPLHFLATHPPFFQGKGAVVASWASAGALLLWRWRRRRRYALGGGWVTACHSDWQLWHALNCSAANHYMSVVLRGADFLRPHSLLCCIVLCQPVSTAFPSFTCGTCWGREIARVKQSAAG